MKAALRCGDQWVLLRNERDEWELPGGQIDDADSSLRATLHRECREELGVDVSIGALVDSWIFQVLPDKRVVIVCFAATISASAQVSLSEEHTAVGLFSLNELLGLPLPDGYRKAIELAANAV